MGHAAQCRRPQEGPNRGADPGTCLVSESVNRQDHLDAVILRRDADAACQRILVSARALEAAGADFILSTCNAAHRFVPALKPRVCIPFPQLADVTSAASGATRPLRPLVRPLASPEGGAGCDCDPRCGCGGAFCKGSAMTLDQHHYQHRLCARVDCGPEFGRRRGMVMTRNQHGRITSRTSRRTNLALNSADRRGVG